MNVLAGVPVKQFGVAKRRLAPRLSPRARSRLGRDLAQRTIDVVNAAGWEPVVIAADAVVAEWAHTLGYRVVGEPAPGGLNLAAAALVAAAGPERRWAIVHADLPLLRSVDLTSLVEDWVIAPSRDGGTNVVAGRGHNFPFAYGAGSFSRHAAAAARRGPVRIAVAARLATDLDTPADFDAAAAHPHGAWLLEYAQRSRPGS